MRVVLSFFTTLLAIGALSAQAYEPLFFSISDSATLLHLEITAGVESRSVATSSIWEYANADFLDEAFKENLLDDLSSTVNFGGGGQLSLDVALDSNRRTRLGVVSNTRGGALLSEDLVKLALRGNAPFAGQLLEVGGSRYEQWRYSGLNVSFLSESGKFEWGVSLLGGNSYRHYDVEEGRVFTAEDGSFVEVDSKYKLEEVRAASLTAVNGLGAALNFSWRASSGIHRWNVGLSDLGLMHWYDGTAVEADTAFRFEGLEAGGPLVLKDSLLTATQDQFQNSLLSERDDSFTRLLPFKVSAHYLRLLENSAFRYLRAGAHYRHLYGYLPRLEVGLGLPLSGRQLLDLDLAFGGFNGLTAGLYYQWQFGEKWQCFARLSSVPGLVLANSSGGSTLRVGGRYRLP